MEPSLNPLPPPPFLVHALSSECFPAISLKVQNRYQANPFLIKVKTDKICSYRHLLCQFMDVEIGYFDLIL